MYVFCMYFNTYITRLLPRIKPLVWTAAVSHLTIQIIKVQKVSKQLHDGINTINQYCTQG